MFKMSTIGTNTSTHDARILAISQLRHQFSDCSKPCHTCRRRCHSSSMSWTWQRRHIYVT